MSRFEDVTIKQDITLSTGNTSSVQLAAGATFTGTAEETYGINGIQVFTSSDQDMTVYVDQGSESGTYEIVDSYPVYAGEADSRVFTSVAPFFRIRVTNNGTATTTTFVQMTAMTPIINPIPRALSEQGGLHTTTDQNVKLAEGNSSSDNLASGATWTGSPVSTLGVVGLQWNLNTDQNCTIYSEEGDGSHTGVGTVETNGTTTLTGTNTVFEIAFVVGDTISVQGETDRIVASIVSDTELTVTVAFSTTASGLTFTHYHWDISYHFDFLATEGGYGQGETVQATGAYWRLRVVNTSSSATTFFRVSGVLCPIATPLPSALSDDRRLKTETTITGRENTDRHVFVSPLNSLTTNSTVRLVGTNFDGTTKDTNFWTETVTGSGSVTQAGSEIKLQPGTTADSTVRYQTNSKARFVVGRPLLFIGFFALTDDPIANNIRRIGAYNGSTGVDGDGYFFQINGTTFGVGYRKAGTDTVITNGSLNGNYGLTWNPVVDDYYRLSIEYGLFGVYYYVNGVLLHKVAGEGEGHLTNFLTLPITMEVINSGGQTADYGFDCLGASISGQGEYVTSPTYYHISGNAATHILKYGPGVLHKIVFNNTSGTSLTVYDNTSAAAPVVAVITTASAALGSWDYNMPFSNGLTLVTVGNSLDATIVYE